MGKIVKGIFGAVLTVVGVVTGNPFLIAAGMSIGQSALKPKMPKPSTGNLDRLRATINPRAPRNTVVGITAMATEIRDEEFTGSQAYFHRFIVVAAHKVHAIDEVWFDDKKAWDSTSGVTADFTGYLWVTTVLEGSSANAQNISARMGTTRRYTGCAYVYLKYKLTGNTKKADSPFAQSVTTRITIRGDGAYFYDPRLDSTVAGGSGAHRADDQTTWAWSDTACRNPALALLFYLLGWRITNPVTSDELLSVGKGIPPARIDLESFAIAANICDESVTKAGGGTEARYRCDGVWSEGDAPTTVIDMLKACMNADLDDVGGKLRLTIFVDDTATSDADFVTDDVIGAFEWQPIQPLDQSFNVIRGTYTNPSDEALYQQVDYPQVETTSPDGIDRIEALDLPMVESEGQAQRLASLRLNRQQFGGVFKADFQATAWRVQKNSIVTLTFAPCGFVDKVFRVAEMDLRDDGVVPLVLRGEDPDIYVAPTLAVATVATASTPYDPFYNPLIDSSSDVSLTIKDGGGVADNQVSTAAIIDGSVTQTTFDEWADARSLDYTLTDYRYIVTGGLIYPDGGQVHIHAELLTWLSYSVSGLTPGDQIGAEFAITRWSGGAPASTENLADYVTAGATMVAQDLLLLKTNYDGTVASGTVTSEKRNLSLDYIDTAPGTGGQWYAIWAKMDTATGSGSVHTDNFQRMSLTEFKK